MPTSFPNLRSTVAESAFDQAVRFRDDLLRQQPWQVHTLPDGVNIILVEADVMDGFVDVDELYRAVCNPPLEALASNSDSKDAIADAADAGLTFAAPDYTQDIARRAVTASYEMVEAAFVQEFHNQFPLWHHCFREEIEHAKTEVVSEVATIDGASRVSQDVLVDCLEYGRQQ